MIEVEHLTKRYGDKVAVQDLSFTVRPGIVTGFLGPNGAGKSTTMRLILGLDRPDRGRATIGGRAYRELPAPLSEVGALLEARAVHTGRSAYNHLLAMAQTHGIGRRRVREVIELVGLSEVAGRRVGGFSLGMGQRLGVAAALLGDPSTLILDEPANGLDPEGILWIRTLLRRLAAEGRTVFLSSHLMAEMAQTADHLVIIGRGRLIADTTVADLVADASRDAAVIARSPQAERLREVLAADAGAISSPEPGVLEIHGLTSALVGEAAARHGIVLHELIAQRASLEQAFMRLTGGEVEFQAELFAQPPGAMPGTVAADGAAALAGHGGARAAAAEGRAAATDGIAATDATAAGPAWERRAR
ncbi:MAG TPA: ATP-binding cassette domain-containing protein [Solirubrobacteraceae bacterium]|nr:ATP-binding cassette domain-containing protein [Solirubrobacteraceae bacterium]